MLLWTLECIYLFELIVYIFSEYILRSGTAGSYSSSTFSFLKNFHTVFLSGYINLHSCQHYRRVLLSPHPLQHLLFIDFLMVVTLTGVRYFTVVLICTSLVINDAEHPVMCLLAICKSSLEKCLFRSSAHVFFHYWVIRAVYIFWSHHLQIFSPILSVNFLFCWWFPLLCKSF